VALVTELPHPQTFRLFDLATRVGLRVPVWTRTAVAGVYGRDSVDRVLLRGPTGEVRELAVDTVVFTGDFIPDNELARLGGLSLDPGTRGPACAHDGTTSMEGIFAAGNLVHPVETADVAARRAAAVGRAAAAWLSRGGAPVASRPLVRVRVADPLAWAVPNLMEPDSDPGPLLVRARAFLDHPRLDVTQGGRLLGSYRLRRMIPNRSHRVPSDWWRRANSQNDVCISVSTGEAARTSTRRA
jgi:hypothetical protein